jgi:outer membrane protein OmpA-like peptidoglycan-associated protein
VASYLNTQGIAPSRIDTRGMGEMQPVASNDTDAGRQQNRRVEIALYASDDYRANPERYNNN